MGLFNIKDGAVIEGSLIIKTGSVTVHNAYTVNTNKTLATKEYVDFVASGGTASLPDIITPATIGGTNIIPVITYDAKGRITTTTTASVTLADITTANTVGSIFNIPSITYDSKGRITNSTYSSTLNTYFINGGNTFSATASIGSNNTDVIIKANNKNILFINDNKVEVRANQYQGYPDFSGDMPSIRASNIVSTLDDALNGRIGIAYFGNDYNSHVTLIDSEQGNGVSLGKTASFNLQGNLLTNYNETPFFINTTDRTIETPYAFGASRNIIQADFSYYSSLFDNDYLYNPTFYNKVLTNLFIMITYSDITSAINFTVGYPNYNEPIINSEFQISNFGTYSVGITPGTSTIYTKSNFLKIPQYGVVTAKYLGSSKFLIWGDLTA